MKTHVPANHTTIGTKPQRFTTPLKAFSVALILCISQLAYAQTGTWTQLATASPDNNMGVMLLLTDGTVICHDATGSSYGTGWDKLTPNAQGSYVNGTWTKTGNMTYDRMFFASQVLPSGKVFVSGGEYGSGTYYAELYDPVANTWANLGGYTDAGTQVKFYDCNSEILPNGTVLIGAQIGPDPSFDCYYYTPSTNALSLAPRAPLNHDEAEWLKLPDSSILFVGIASTNSCRFRPQTNTWITDATVPVSLYDQYGEEAGCATMLPNGKAIFFGATQYNAIYTPTGTAAKGSWTAAAQFPKIGGGYVGQVDAPGAMMVNGHELLAVSPAGTGSGSNEFLDPIYFLEYDYTTNAFTQVTSKLPATGADDVSNSTCDFSNFLDLPDGTVLMGLDQDATYSKDYFVYTPGSAAIAAGKPTINSILPDGCPNYKITGKLFNGISEGASFGDDWQCSTNFPLVRLTNAAGNVYYAKTTDWNRVGAVQTDSLEDTAIFTPPSTLPAGTYSLVVVVNGFASNPTIFTTLQASTATQSIACNGGTATATANVTGGISPYTYSWSKIGGSGATGTGLTIGTYTVTVTDKNDCTSTATVVITQPAKLSASATLTSNASCSGNTGGASSTVSGGTSPYTYSWTGGGGSNSSATGLSAGTYTLSVTDNNGCSATSSITITQAPGITISANTTSNISCNGSNNGSASSTVSGGTSPYTYAWTGGANTATVSGLSVGTYTVSITDHNGCNETASVTITEPNALKATGSVTSNVTCKSNTGSASSSVSGGTSPYTYSWTGGGTSSTVSGLSAGTYTLSVTDHNGCTSSSSVTITQSTGLNASANTTSNVNCNGGSDGSVTATVSGGTSPYTYSWTGGGKTATISGLSAGTYTVTITDANGCSGTASITVTEPNVLKATGTVTSNVTCKSNTGSASSSVSGGTSPYTYSWTGGGTSPTVSGLSAGTYTLSVTDHNGCTSSSSVTITQSTGLNASANTTSNVNCNGASDGSVTATVSGGISPFTYSWTGGGKTATINGLSAGTYTVTITDANGCSGTASATITEPATAVGITIQSATNVGCNGMSTGSATANATGGTAPYTYSWSPRGGANATASNLSAGNYTVTVIDNKGCTSNISTTITEPTAILFKVDTTNCSPSSCNGGAQITGISGGAVPYTYSWSPGGGTNDTIAGKCTGNYCFTVTDHNGCSQTGCVYIDITTGVNAISNSSAINIYPSPSTGLFTIAGVSQGQIIELYDVLGQLLNSARVDNTTMYFNISNRADGIYLVRILNTDGSLATQKKIIKTQ